MSEVRYHVEKWVDNEWQEVGYINDSDLAIGMAETDADQDLTFHPRIFLQGDGLLSDPTEDGIVYRITRV